MLSEPLLRDNPPPHQSLRLPDNAIQFPVFWVPISNEHLQPSHVRLDEWLRDESQLSSRMMRRRGCLAPGLQWSLQR